MALELLQKHDTEEIIRQMFVEKKISIPRRNNFLISLKNFSQLGVTTLHVVIGTNCK